ncbi:hypothetical protein DPMN_041655 [Dreissena polymorpha]|uniref:Uncharacterized protein n=1 Tax=Dreissena polymorpha TaxID=45954 RepID=A0A9D4CXC2_DREPO|nr:hypothetical protein DPMN_041655 [Dreissena polymorpha]
MESLYVCPHVFSGTSMESLHTCPHVFSCASMESLQGSTSGCRGSHSQETDRHSARSRGDAEEAQNRLPLPAEKHCE